MSIFQRYAHIFWIPFFPIGKIGVSVCTHCQQTLKLNDMEGPLKLAYQNGKLQTKMPIWIFSGLFILAVGIVALTINEKRKDQRNAQWIMAPIKGDVFEIKTKDDKYTLLKVNAVVKDSVYAIYNKYQTDGISGLDKMKEKGDSAFVATEVYGFAKKDLKKLLTEGTIIGIDR